jgi:hypothetical protein
LDGRGAFRRSYGAAPAGQFPVIFDAGNNRFAAGTSGSRLENRRGEKAESRYALPPTFVECST